MNVFNRKDEKVKKDAINMKEADFLNVYKGKTTESVLKSVYAGFAKERKVIKVADDATEMVEVSTFEAEDEATVEVFKTETGSTVVEITEAKDEVEPTEEEVKTSKSKKAVVVAEGEPKAGRTPRMRELIKDGKDKAAAKAILEQEGFTCAGSGFHSEWNRVSKSVK